MRGHHQLVSLYPKVHNLVQGGTSIVNGGSPIIKNVVPSPALAPTPPSGKPSLLVPDRGSPGLFGTRTLPHDSSRRNKARTTPNARKTSALIDHMATCVSQTSFDSGSPIIKYIVAVGSQPFVGPTLFVPDRGSPGVFGAAHHVTLLLSCLEESKSRTRRIRLPFHGLAHDSGFIGSFADISSHLLSIL